MRSLTIFLFSLVALATNSIDAAEILVYNQDVFVNSPVLRNDGPYTVGTRFQTGSEALVIEALGVQILDGNPGSDSSGVGIWSVDGLNLLASVAVHPLHFDSAVGTYRYRTLDNPVVLEPDTQYLLGAVVGGLAERFVDGGTGGSVEPFNVAPGLTLLEDRWAPSSGVLTAPTLTGGPLNGPGRWGAANALYSVASVPVPEPGTALLMGLGLAGLASRRR